MLYIFKKYRNSFKQKSALFKVSSGCDQSSIKRFLIAFHVHCLKVVVEPALCSEVIAASSLIKWWKRKEKKYIRKG